MSSSHRSPVLASLGLALLAACGGSADTTAAPTVADIKPACGDRAAATTVTIHGTLPVEPVVSLSDPSGGRLDTAYLAWLGDVELSDVTWKDPGQLTAVIPAGLAAGSFDLTVEGPAGGKGTLTAAFEVREGRCPTETAALILAAPAAAPATVTVGQDVTVTATVQNVGQSAALAVTASVTSAPAGFTLHAGPSAPQDVPAGQSRTFSWTYTATAAVSGVFAIDASGTAQDTGLAVAAAAVSSNAVLVNAGAFLTANALVEPTRATAGQLVTVILTVTNHATAAAVATPAIVVSGPVTAGNGPAARSIPAGASQAFQWTYTAAAPGKATFTASVSGRDPAGGAALTVPTAPIDVAVQAPPGLSATLSVPPTVELGDFTVTMLVSQAGGAAAADVAGVVPDEPGLVAGSTASAVLRSGPTGSPAAVVAGQPAVAFTWVFTATAPGVLSLASTARGRDANSGAAVASGLATSGPAQVAMRTVGGTVSGLSGTGLVLRNGSDSLAISASGAFTFPTLVGSGESYAVTVATQPSGPSQTCTVTDGSGTVGGAAVTSVGVTCSTNAFTVGGTVSGLQGGGLVLHSGSDSLPISAGGTFAFPTPVPSGAGYSVTVTAQPSGPSQTCTVSNGSGTVGGLNVTSVGVTCSTKTFTVGGTVSGLSGTGLVLRNGGESLPIAADGSFAFPTPVASGAGYSVTVTAQPSGPSQACSVTNGSGTVGGLNVTSVAVSCATRSFTVGGTVSGLVGSGFRLSTAGEPNLDVAAGASTFTFASPLASGTTYDVTVVRQPSSPSQTCTVSSGSGTVGGANVTGVSVTCSTSAFTVGGAVSGLAGSGLRLSTAGEPNLDVAAGASTFTFDSPLASGTTYDVTVVRQPSSPSQTCTVSNGSGTVGGADVTNVIVSCSINSFTVGGTVSGLVGGGLRLSTAGEPNLDVAAGASTFTFASPLASGTTYDVTVARQPSSPSQTCTVSSGSGTVGAAKVTDVSVTCSTRTFTVGGTVSGLAGSGLVLHNGSDSLSISASGAFTFPIRVASGAGYSVTATAQPTGPSQSCTVSNGSGTVGAANVTSVIVSCLTNAFTVGGTVSGLVGGGLVLHNGSDSLPIATSGSFTFPTPVASGSGYAVTVTAQPTGPSQTCTLSNRNGTVGGADVTSVGVSCATSSFTVGGTVSGLSGSGLVLHNGSDSLLIAANGSFTFPTPVASGSGYAVTVTAQPTGPSQTCTLSNRNGTVGAANVSNVSVTCSTNSFSIGGTVSGLLGSGLMLHNGADSLPIAADGSFTFPTPVASGAGYAVTVTAQPSGPSQTCTLSNRNGTVGAANVSNVSVTCSTNSFSIGGTVSGLLGSGLMLHNGADSLPIAADGSFTFPTPVASGAGYAVTVTAQPSGPSQTCSLTNGSGTVGAADVTNVGVSCSTRAFTVGGTVSGLLGSGLMLRNGADSLPISSDGSFTFPTPVASGGAYAVTVTAQPSGPSQTCSVSNGSGTVGAADVTSVAVSCVTDAFTVSGTVVGLTGDGLVLRNGNETLPVAAGSSSFTFATPVASGATYAVTVEAQPAGQTCTVTGGGDSIGGGTIGATAVSSILATCLP